jgi:uncharacterized membrane protein YcaP (DUF421 family)
MILLEVHWKELFELETSFWEIFIRGTVVYIGLFSILRIVLKRESATLGMTDLLVVVLLADAAQNAMAGEYRSITDGLLLVMVIVGWSYFLNFLGHEFPVFQRIIKPPKLLLVKDGIMIRRNMRKEFITEDELMAEVRTSGLKDIEEVEEAYMESNGRISVIARKNVTTPVHKMKERKLI